MFEGVRIVGHGRVGTAVGARLRERGIDLEPAAPELVLLCVPDREIAAVAAALEPGPWVAHVSGATPLAALEPHRRRFGLHPLQTIVLGRGPEQLDGAWAAVTAETEEARRAARGLAGLLGLRPFDLADDRRALYHAGAALASGYLVTLYRAASALVAEAGAPPEALLPLLQRTIDNGFEPTGPLVRGDRTTVDAHLAAIGEHRPELLPLYRALAETTAA